MTRPGCVVVLIAALLQPRAAPAETVMIEASATSERAAVLQPLRELAHPMALSGAALRERLQLFSPPSYEPPTQAQVWRAGETVVEDCERANGSMLAKAIEVLERGMRSNDSDVIERAYRCVLSGHLRKRRTVEGEAALARVLSVLPIVKRDAFEEEWRASFRVGDERFHEVTLFVPKDAAVFVNGSYFSPSTRSASRGRTRQLDGIVLRMVPGEYFVQVQGFPPARVVVSTDRVLPYVFSPIRQSLRDNGLHYPSAGERNDLHAADAALLAVALRTESTLVYWAEGTDAHFSLVAANSRSSLRHVVVPLAEAVAMAQQLLSGTALAETSPDFTQPQPGLVAVHLGSERAQTVVVQVTSLWPGAKTRCETPCTLYLPPGRAEISSGSPSVADGKHAFSVADTGTKLELRSPSRNWNTTGKVVASVGATVLLTTAAVFIITCAGTDALYDAIPGVPDNDSGCPTNLTMGVMAASGATLAGVGFGIWLGSRPGIAERQTLRASVIRSHGERAFLGVAPSADGFMGTLKVGF